MARYDFTRMDSMLGREICFLDNRSFDRLKREFPKQFLKYRWEYGFGCIDGFCCDIDVDEVLHFSILVEGDYHSLDDIEILYLS
jgi:hypothetical protein